jgi:amino acid adenylation domain-containing protein
MSTIRDLIDRMADTQPDLAFLISPETGRVLTFEGLQKQAYYLCGRFRQMGLEHGDKIALLMDNGLFTAQLFLGAMYGGFVPVPLNVRAGVSQLSYTLDHCDAKVVFVGSKYDGLIKEVMPRVQRPVEVISADLDSVPEASEAPSMTGTLPPLRAEDAALLMYSSGTTGQPNGAVHTHRSVLAHGRNSACAHELTAADRSLLVLPVYHINAECVTLIPTLMSGGSVIIPHGFVVSEFWNWLDDYRCTWSALVPTIISQLLDWKDPKAESRAAAFQRIRFLRTSSAPLSPSLHREFLDKFKLLLIQAMGSTETGSPFSNPLPPGKNKIGSPGLPWGFETKIVSRDGAELPAGVPGEVLMRGDGMMQGYYKDPVGTAAALDAEGWLHTGDLAYRDEDGYFFVVGRSKELIIKGGMNIAPKQIDEVLETHPAVLEAAAVGVPDRYVGEDLIAFAVLRNGMSCDERELLGFCESRLGHFKTPTRIHFVRDLPKGPSGKVQRLKLQETAAQRSIFEPGSCHGEAPGRDDGQASGVGAAVPSTPIEQIIAETWAKLLTQPQLDVHSNFFSLGGHSLLAIQCLSLLREKLPIALSLSDFFENATVAQQAALIRKRLRPDNISSVDSTVAWEQELLQKVGSAAADEAIPLRDRSLPCPLSPNQQRIWFIEQLNSGVPVYNESEAVRLRGELNIDMVEKALNVIIARHEILRTTIETAGDEPSAVVHESWPLRLKQIDLSMLPPAQREAEVERLLIDEPRLPYHLHTAPGIRATLLRLGQMEHVLILMMHHIVCDWSSEGVLWRELSALYRAGCGGQPLELPALPIQHGDYAIWHQQQLTRKDLAEDLAYWEESLRGAPALLDLPTDKPRPRTLSYRGARQRFLIPSRSALALRDCSRREGVSLFTVFTAALDTLLYRYTGQEDILVGIPLADRDRPELQSMIGFLLHTHVLRTQLSADLSFRELLARVQKGVLDLYAHRAPPFDRVVSRVQPQRNQSYSPLFQVMINWRDRDQQLSFIGLDGLEVESLLSESRTSKFDLTLMLTDVGDEIWVEMEYSTELFDDARIERMAGHLRTLLEGAVTNPEQPLADLPLLTDAEREQLLVEWNRTEVSYPRDRCLHELIEEQVQRAPEATAVVFEEQHLTYGKLNERANQLARHLQRLGVGPETLVGICMERSLQMVVGLLGILKAGGAYVPLDPEYPKERLAFMLEDARPLALVTQRKLQEVLPSHQARIVYVDASDETAGEITREFGEELKVHSNCLAYVLYTSGSTGRPKGVAITHRSAVALATWARQIFTADEFAGVLFSTSICFDLSIFELFVTLANGGKVILAKNALEFPSLRTARHVRMINTVPSAMAELMRGGVLPQSVIAVNLAGEPLSQSQVDQLYEQYSIRRVFDLYGPTETTTYSAFTLRERGGKATIGRPISNTNIYILDPQMQPSPIGVPGELHIGGTGLARGYHNRPELTAEKFIPDPFRSEPGARLYKTGDLARYLPDGAIEYLGRLDHQVKIRGFRIELGEIESVLAGIPRVREAVVVAREDVPGDKRLVAYLTVKEGERPKDSELRAVMQATLPEYMLPSAFVTLDRFPLTPNGKVDRKALPAPEYRRPELGKAFVAPRTSVEKVLADIWGEVLRIKQVGLHDNFFQLGGHSLLAIQAIVRMQKKLGMELSVADLFEAPTIERLVARLTERRQALKSSRLIPVSSGGTKPPLFVMPSALADNGYFLAKALSAGLGPDQPVYCLRLHGPQEGGEFDSIEALASYCVNIMVSEYGRGPFKLIGYSLGGTIAYEMACQLSEAGHEVQTLAVIDTGSAAINSPLPDKLRRVPATLINMPNMIWWKLKRQGSLGVVLRKFRIWLDQLWRRTASGIHQHLFLQKLPVELREAAEERSSLRGKYHQSLSAKYDQRQYRGKIVLFRAKYREPFRLQTLDLGWAKFASAGVDVIVLPGDHDSIIKDDRCVSRICATLERQIA